jgi:hypothetical protein
MPRYGQKLGHIAKEGAATALVLYPASKLVWAVDSAAKNVAPVGLPSYARTPLVAMGLGAVAAFLPAGYWTEKVGEMVLAAGLVQTIQQAGATVPGASGTIDTAINKAFMPIANLGMKGYVTRLRGYVVDRQMRGYVTEQAGGGMGMGLMQNANVPAPVHPNDQIRGAGLRGYQAEHR